MYSLIKLIQSLPQVLELALWNSSSQVVRELAMLTKDYGLTEASSSNKNKMGGGGGTNRNKPGKLVHNFLGKLIE